MILISCLFSRETFLEKPNRCLCSVIQIPIVPATSLLHCKTIDSYDGSWHEIDYAIGETISYLSIIDARRETSVDHPTRLGAKLQWYPEQKVRQVEKKLIVMH